MLAEKKIIVILPAHNEEAGIPRLVSGITFKAVDTVLVVDDASSDRTAGQARSAGAEVISHATRRGCGPSIRTGIDHALKNRYDIIVVMAGNGKDNPAQIESLVTALIKGNLHLVQGSRYMKGGTWAHMPLHRIIGTRGYSLLFSLLTGRVITDGTNGFRAFRASLFDDSRINIWQTWLNNYEVESYIYYKTVTLGYPFREIPVSKIYPRDHGAGYTKMRPFADWWSHFRPILLLRLGLKR